MPLDALSTGELVDEIISGQEHVFDVVRASRSQIITAVDLLASTSLSGGRILLLGAGTSGRLAMLEAVEIPGTFGVAPDRIVGLIAGANPMNPLGRDDAEDDQELAMAEIAALGVGAGDVVVALAASGATPYTVAAAEAGRGAGAAVIVVTNVAGSPLGAAATVCIEVPTGPEILAGSTRLAAGTAQKLVLNTLTTAAMSRAGRVHGRLMVDVVPANAKLRRRATDVVAASCGVPREVAGAALRSCGGDVRAAIVSLICGLSPTEAALRAGAHRTVQEAIDSTAASTGGAAASTGGD